MIFYLNSLNIQICVSQCSRESNGVGLRVVMRISSHNYTNPGYGLSLVDTLWNAGSYRQPLEQEGNSMT